MVSRGRPGSPDTLRSPDGSSAETGDLVCVLLGGVLRLASVSAESGLLGGGGGGSRGGGGGQIVFEISRKGWMAWCAAMHCYGRLRSGWL